MKSKQAIKLNEAKRVNSESGSPQDPFWSRRKWNRLSRNCNNKDAYINT